MKSIVIFGVVASLLFLSGCSDKAPVVDKKAETVQEVVQEAKVVETEVVAPENSNVGSNDGIMKLSEAEAKLGSIYFDYDKFAITSAMKSKLSSNSAVVKQVTDTFNVKLEGNCDEWGSDEYNFALGLKRANAVKQALVAEGTDASKISMVSYGESNPSCADKTQECWAKNRRVDFSLLP